MQIDVKNISFKYKDNTPLILKNLDLTLDSTERVSLVGSSGCGKSTLAKIIAGYLKADKGEVLVEGKKMKDKGYCPIQMIYQHPENAVNPRWKMKEILSEGWNPDKELLEEIGIEESWFNRWPSELSGGELQRFCIARALGLETKFLICDEISTMLDVITQAQIWNLLLKISKERKIGILIVTHNIELAKRVSDRIIYMDEINN